MAKRSLHNYSHLGSGLGGFGSFDGLLRVPRVPSECCSALSSDSISLSQNDHGATRRGTTKLHSLSLGGRDASWVGYSVLTIRFDNSQAILTNLKKEDMDHTGAGLAVATCYSPSNVLAMYQGCKEGQRRYLKL